jgi:hypothetical protein
MKNAFNPAAALPGSVALPFVIPRACDFFDLFVFSAHVTGCFSTPSQNRHPERSASQIRRIKKGLRRGVEGPRRRLLADALLGFPATNHEGKQKSQAPSAAEGSAVPRTIPGNVFDGVVERPAVLNVHPIPKQIDNLIS